MHPLRTVLELWSLLTALLGVAVVVMTAMRGRRIPECFACGAMKVRPTRPIGLLDGIARLILIRPYRCEGCQGRFRALRFSDQPARLSGTKARAVKIVFQFREGFSIAIRSAD